MKFSIVLPTLNEQTGIVCCLSALQPWRNRSEIIVADGGSIDATRTLAMPLADRVVLSDRGRAVQMNRGAEQASGDVLVFLHADTTLPSDALDRMQSEIDAGAHWGRFDVRLNDDRAWFRVIETLMNWRSRITGIATGDQAIFVRRETFRSVGGYPGIALMEDVALSTRLKRIGKPACLSCLAVSSARKWQQHGIIRTVLLMWRLRLAYFFGADPDDLARQYYGDS